MGVLIMKGSRSVRGLRACVSYGCGMMDGMDPRRRSIGKAPDLRLEAEVQKEANKPREYGRLSS